MNILRGLAVTATSGALLLAGTTGAGAATDSGTTRASAAPTTCTIHAKPPYLQGGRIKGDGDITCNGNVAALQLRINVQKKMGARWVNIGTPVAGTKYNVYKVWGTANAPFSHGTFRTKSTGKVLFYGESTWRPIQAVSGPRTA